MATNVLEEILKWSKDRATWQRDALRRLFTDEDLSSNDISELVEICKSDHGLVPKPPANFLAAEHLPIAGTFFGDVTLTSITHVGGVNALAPNQTVAFGPGLTVVFGENAAGKSGYTRVLKSACRARGTEAVLGNVLGGSTPGTPHAIISATANGNPITIDWTPTSQPSQPLASICVFDSHCVPVYLEEKTEVAFRPFGLDVFDKLSSLCAEIRSALDKEKRLLGTTPFVVPAVATGTKVFQLLQSVTGLTSVDEVRKLATLSDSDTVRLKDLETQKADLLASNPADLSKDLTLKARRFSALATHFRSIEVLFSVDNRATLQKAVDERARTRVAVQALRDAALVVGLTGTGGDEWRGLWDAAQDFSAVAYPGRSFPPTDDALCLLCQQPIGTTAAERLTHFAEYVSSTTQRDLREAEAALEAALAPLRSFVDAPKNIDDTMSELQVEDATLHQTLERVAQNAPQIAQELRRAAEAGQELPAFIMEVEASARIEAIAERFRHRAAVLREKGATFAPALQRELDELAARQVLLTNLAVVESEIERRKRLSAYDACINETTTSAITKKSTELTKELVTDALRTSFRFELAQIGFTHTSIEVMDAGGAKGVLRHQIVFAHAPGVHVGNVLSEGEARALSLAAFLTELSIAPTKSAIIFDDPVSSLDHIWREKIAKRLVAEAKLRQVIVFTHDLLFWSRLRSEAEAKDVPLSLQYVRRQGLAGVCLPDVPWFAMSTKERIGHLKNALQKLGATFKKGNPDDYERETREIYGLLREAWEIALGDVLLNGVVERYRPSIETQRARNLHDITPADLETLEKEMTEASRWIRGHAAAAADGTPLPTSEEIKLRVETFEGWVRAINSRRK